MGRFFRKIRAGLAGILALNGRMALYDFWPYAAVIVGLMFLAGFGMGIFLFIDTIQRIVRFAAEHHELTTVQQGPGHYSVSIDGFHPELMPDFSVMITISAGCMVFAAVMLGAAIVRRLHDTGRTGLWALMPLPFGAFSLYWMYGLFQKIPAFTDQLPENAAVFAFVAEIFWSVGANLLWLAALAVLVILLCGKGNPQTNRFGPPAAPA